MKLKLGMNGDAEFVLDRKEDVITVPVTAIVEEDDKEFIWIAENGTARRVEVKTGLTSINDIEITEGLEQGQEVILRPPSNIEEGKRVIIDTDE